MNQNNNREVVEISVEDIIPNRFQPRLTFDDKALQELSSSIKQHGIIQPLVLRKLGDKYEIIAGERRYKAAQIAGLTTVPAVISNIDDDKSAEVALIENIQRKNLTAIEEAKSYKNLLDRGYLTQEQLAEKLGVSQSTIANKLRLLNLDEEVQDALLNEKISERHARALLTLPTKEDQIKWLNKILTDRLTVRQLDIELKKALNKDSEDDGSDIPLVNLTPNINEIKENALDINPAQGLHDIESMLKPSTPGEKTYNLNNPIENVETLDFDEEPKKTEEVKQPNKFFNFLEDEQANMNEDTSIDDVFNSQPKIDTPVVDNNVNNEIINSDILENNQININNTDNTILPVTNNVVDQPIEINDNPTVEENNIINEAPTNNFFNFGNTPENNDINQIEQNNNENDNNIIEVVPEKKNDEVFDPMSMVNTLEPDYQEKIEEAQGTDLKTAINEIRNVKEDLLNKGFNINIDEADLGDSYTITINIIK